MPSTYQELTLPELSHHPVKLGFEFEIASVQNHDAVGASLRELFGPRSVGTVSSSYNAHHNGGYDKWNVTGDNSIEAENNNIHRVEIVSPILTPENCERTLTSLFDYLRDKRAKTNSSTGMHITVSHPRVSRDLDHFDALKFGLLIDDIGMTAKYRGSLENRFANSLLHLFCKNNRTAFNEGRIRRSDVSIPWSGDPELLFLLTSKEPKIRRCLIDIDKYRSINLSKVSNSLVEVRSPGGDYLSLGAADAIKTAQKILSALVYSVDPTAHSDVYKRLFISMFEDKIKPRPRPVVHDSPAGTEFQLNGYQFVIAFSRHSQAREIDGWDIRQNRAIYVSRIKITAPINREQQPDGNRTIFNTGSGSGPSYFSMTISFESRISDSSYLPESLTPETIASHLNRSDYHVSEINTNASELRGISQFEQAIAHVAAIRELLGSEESMFYTRATLDISRVLTESLPSSSIQLITSLLRPRSVRGASPENTVMGHVNNWRPIENYLTNSLESHRQAAERARNIQGSDNFSTALQARLNHLRQANAGASNRITNSNNDLFRAAAQEAAGRPVPFDATAEEVTFSAADTSDYSVALPGAITAFRDEFGNVTQDILFSFHNLVTDNQILPLTGGNAISVDHVVRQIELFNQAIERHPRLAVILSQRLASSRTLSQNLSRTIDNALRVIPVLANTSTYEDQRNIARNTLAILISVCRVYKTLGALSSGARVSSLRAFFEQMVTVCSRRLGVVDQIPRSLTRHAARLTRSLIEACAISGTRARARTSVSAPEVEVALELLVRFGVLSSILRPTHVGRMRVEITGQISDMTAVNEPCAAEEDML